MARREILETTLEDLIVALTDETAPCVRDEGEVNRVVAYILADVLYNSGKIVTNRPVSIRTNDQRKTLVVR